MAVELMENTLQQKQALYDLLRRRGYPLRCALYFENGFFFYGPMQDHSRRSDYFIRIEKHGKRYKIFHTDFVEPHFR